MAVLQPAERQLAAALCLRWAYRRVAFRAYCAAVVVGRLGFHMRSFPDGGMVYNGWAALAVWKAI